MTPARRATTLLFFLAALTSCAGTESDDASRAGDGASPIASIRVAGFVEAAGVT